MYSKVLLNLPQDVFFNNDHYKAYENKLGEREKDRVGGKNVDTQK